MNVLIIGAGAVGQVFARHLQDGGASVTFLVREHHREHFNSTAGRVMPLYLLNEGKNRRPYLFKDFEVHYSIDDLKSTKWDQVWFCVSSNVMDSTWIANIASATGDATIIILSPEGPAILASGAPFVSRVLFGVITFISWQAPLEDEILQGPAGVAYWFPTLTQVPVGGPKDRLKPVLRMLKKGKMPVTKGASNSKGGMVKVISAVLMPLVVGLEGADWSFSEFSKGKWSKIVAEASFEAYQVAGKKEGGFVEFIFWALINGFTLSVGLRIASILMPFNFETYMKFHFLKVREQTIWMVNGMLEEGAKREIDTPNLKILYDQLS